MGDLVEREANDGSTPSRHVRFHDRGHLLYSDPPAAMLGYIAHYNFGLSRLEIRVPAVVGAIIIAVVIATSAAIDFFCRRLRKP